MDMFERRPQMQRMVKIGLLGMEYDALDDTGEVDYDFDNWGHGYDHFHGYPRLADISHNRELSGSAYEPPLSYWTAHDFIHQHPIKVQPKERNTERKARLLQETKKSKEKAQKKRLKKQKQKERKRLEQLEKEKMNPVKLDEKQVDAQQSKAEKNTGKEKSKDDTNLSIKESASDELTESSDSSEDESGNEDNDSSDSEELDMTSAFVRLAKLKLEQKPRPERQERKKMPTKEERKSVPNKNNEDQEAEKKDSASCRSPTIEDNIKMSTELANIGNKFASSGDFPSAVKYFTDAIKFNPIEFKLFGNRSFCFEKMQEYEKALTDAELCLRLSPGWVKGLFRKGRALAGLKRYEEAAQAFREVLQLDSACGEAAQELMRVQITQLMEYGFTREQSSNALIIHGTVKKALEVLTKLSTQPGAATFRPAQVANVTGVSPVLSANTSTLPASPQSKDAPLLNKPLGPVQNTSNVQSQPKLILNQASISNSRVYQTPAELFPIWIGNVIYPVSESVIANLFSKVGFVYSVKVLTIKRCAFVNFTKQEHCEEAIRRFHGYDLNGVKIAVRYPDRIPHGMGISKSALKADDLQDENMRHNEWGNERNAVGGRRPLHPYRHVPDHRDDH